jgi:hypothetical protein
VFCSSDDGAVEGKQQATLDTYRQLCDFTAQRMRTDEELNGDKENFRSFLQNESRLSEDKGKQLVQKRGFKPYGSPPLPLSMMSQYSTYITTAFQ